VAADTLDKFLAGNMIEGVEVHRSDFLPIFKVHPDSYNLSQGINEGTGPRYGMSPIPYQSQGNAPTSGYANSVVYSENLLPQSPQPQSDNRTRFYGIVPIILGARGVPQKRQVYYVWLLARVNSTAEVFQMVMGSTNTGSFFYPEPDIAAGLPPNSDLGLLTYAEIHGGPGLIHFDGIATALPLVTFRNTYLTLGDQVTTPTTYVNYSSLVVSGREVPMKNYVGEMTAFPTGPNGPYLGFSYYDSFNSLPAGIPTFYNTRLFSQRQRSMSIQTINKVSGPATLSKIYHFSALDITTGTTAAEFDQAQTTALSALAYTSVEGRVDGATVNLDASVINNVGLVHDEANTLSTGYTAIFVAAKKALCAIYQEWLSSGDGTLPQWVDLTARRQQPTVAATVDPNTLLPYTEADSAGNGTQKSTCWTNFPAFVAGTALPKDSSSAYNGTIHVTLGDAGSGILRANTQYEIAYSIYDKLYDTESNVGVPATFQTGADDFVKISLFRDAQTAGVFQQNTPNSYTRRPYPSQVGTFASNYYYNYFEYRFYYRIRGTFEWLPALQMDAAQALFDCTQGVIWACSGAVAALPGGQPGGFNDYSSLPSDAWIDVKTFQERVFWISSKQMCWSYRNNPFSYPGRNSVACPSGEFRGGIVHVYRGQTEQQLSSKIMLFGTTASYVGRFTGVQTQQPVQVSPTDVGSYPVDGSDFTLDYWSSFTAFSGRAAVVAEGDLFFWGPAGVFVDDGNSPEKISLSLEPDIFTLYDPNRTDEIHATYNDVTKEITWFYPPSDTTVKVSYGLTFNIRTKAFLYQKFACQVDSSQQLTTDKSSVNRPTLGYRTVVSVRKDSTQVLQRPYFYDYRNRSGDMAPGSDLIVQGFTTPSAGLRDLSLAFSYDPAKLASIAPGDLITLQQLKQYATGLTQGDDMVASVVSVNTIGGSIRVQLPTGANLDASATLAQDQYFPVWHATTTGAGINGIPYLYKSNYWQPNGFSYWAYWLYVLTVMKTKLLPSTVPLTFNLSYRTPISLAELANSLTITNNSDNNCQIYHPMSIGNQNIEGQAIRYSLSGIQYGSEWVLQYLEAHASRLDGLQLKLFEG